MLRPKNIVSSPSTAVVSGQSSRQPSPPPVARPHPFDELAGIGLRGKRRQPVADVRADAARQRLNGLQPRGGVRAVKRGERQAGLDFLLHGSVGFERHALTKEFGRRFIDVAEDFLDGRQPAGRVGTRQIEPRDCDAQHAPEPVVGADLLECAGGSCTGGCERHRIDQLERGERAVGGLDDEDAGVRGPGVQTVVEPGGEHPRTGVAARGQLANGLLLFRVTGGAEAREQREKRVVGRLGDRRRAHPDGRGEQQHQVPPPAAPSKTHL
jgi:hypothetical protein